MDAIRVEDLQVVRGGRLALDGVTVAAPAGAVNGLLGPNVFEGNEARFDRGMAGLFLSAFARSEFQAVQFMPAFVLPQILLSGLYVPRGRMARWPEIVSDALPLAYAYDALARAAADDLGSQLALDAALIAGVALLAVALGAATLRRRTA